MLWLDRMNEGCSIDGSKESVRLGLKQSSDQVLSRQIRLEDRNKGRELWSSNLSRLGQGNSLRLGSHKSGILGRASSSRSIDQSLRPGRTKTAV